MDKKKRMEAVKHIGDELSEALGKVLDLITYLKGEIKELMDVAQSFNGNGNEVDIRIPATTAYLMKFVGNYYRWSGDGPLFDCSGLIVEELRMNGVIGRNEDLTADQLWKRFEKQRVAIPSEGCVVCYWRGPKNEIVGHVEYCINDKLSIGASGGGKNTKTVEDAIKHNAFIKVRPYPRTDRKLAGYFNPFLKEEQ